MSKRFMLTAALAAASANAFAAGVTYKLDPTHTNVIASWNHFGFSNPSANFGGVEGTLVYDAADVARSSVQVTLPLSGMDSFVPKLDEHLRGADFFDAARFPEARFSSTRVEAVAAGKLRITGDLTIRGVTRPLVLDATLNKAGEHPMLKVAAIGFDATATLKRSAFGLGGFAPAVSDEVTLRISTEASAPAPAAAGK